MRLDMKIIQGRLAKFAQCGRCQVLCGRCQVLNCYIFVLFTIFPRTVVNKRVGDEFFCENTGWFFKTRPRELLKECGFSRPDTGNL
jgi:hypothetical protein